MVHKSKHDKQVQEISQIVQVVTESVEKEVRRKSTKRSRLFKPMRYEKLGEDHDSVIEAIRNIGESSLIFAPQKPRLMRSRKMGISETSEIERKLVQKILKNYMITENMKEYFLIE